MLKNLGTQAIKEIQEKNKQAIMEMRKQISETEKQFYLDKNEKMFYPKEEVPQHLIRVLKDIENCSCIRKWADGARQLLNIIGK